MVEIIFLDHFLKNQNWAYFWINSLTVHTVCFYCMPSWGLSKYFDTSCRLLVFNCIFLCYVRISEWIHTLHSWNPPPPPSPSPPFLEKRRASDFSNKNGGGGGCFKKGGITCFHTSLLFPVLTFAECLVCECVCVFCLFTPFLSVLFVFYRKNLVFKHLINR